MKTLKSIVLFLIISLNYNIVAQTASQEYTTNADVNVTTEELDKNIDKLIPKAKKNKLNEKQLILLTNSYHEANQADHQRIMELKKSGQPDIWIEIYHRIDNINTRQNKIAVLPDNIKSTMNFRLLDLDNEIRNSKEKAELYICAKSNLLLKNINDENLEEVESLLSELYKINPQSNNIDDLRLKLIILPSKQILFRIATPTELYFPENFAQLALDFDDNTIWGVPFDIVPHDNKDYDLMIRIMIEKKTVSPERVNTATFEERKDGKVVKVTDKTMTKTATIFGQIEFVDVEKEKILLSTPFDIASTFAYHYAEIDGERDACSSQTLELLGRKAIDFPSDEALFKDVARKLNDIIKSHYQKN